MKLFEIADTLKFRQDNPGGDWLKGHHEYYGKKERNEHGAPKFGGPSITGYWSRNVLLPVDVVSKLPGAAGEHLRTREDDLNSLLDYMREHNTLPSFNDDGIPYVPFIQIWMDGTAWIGEGNHRIKAAKILKWKYIPVHLEYFIGGEDEDGPLTPEKVKAYDARAISEGYLPSVGFVGIP